MPSKSPTRLILAGLAAGIFSAPAPGAADGEPVERSGLLLGASLGPGTLDIGCAGCGDLSTLTGALSLSAQLGVMITPKLALGVEHWVTRWEGRDNYWFGDSRDHVVQEHMTTAGAQFWLGKRLWLRGGIGVSHHRTDVESYRNVRGDAGPPASAETPEHTAAAAAPELSPQPPPAGSGRAPALVVGAGYEVIHTARFAVDLAVRAGASGRAARGVSTNTFAITVGASWF